MSNIHVLRTEVSRTVSALRGSINDKGVVRTAERVAAVAAAQVLAPLIRTRRQNNRFEFRGERLPYTLARYNNSFLNERAVEVSIAHWFLSKNTGRVLEVGNVLRHYGVTGQTVLDKYEVIPGVLNYDVVDFVPESPFDTVVAISTLEHVGWDETPRQPDNVFRAMDNVKKFGGTDGRVLVTVPIGHNKVLDAGLRAGKVSFPQETWLARTNRRNDWAEVEPEEALSRTYGEPYTGANAIYVGMVLSD
ncbi:MAG TPA: hypothetical protein VH333_21165 [Pseudonocardiaceae bacterium]|jgi:hypothetical protein|nr:hypothetical protein [Pseudonocardiaceae bacterium]